VRFAHESEAHLAALFDFYGIEWEYEPVEFVLSWDERGRPTSAFRPDFFLPRYGQYVELTTMRQGLVTRKHAKIRRLNALYPEVHLRLLYRKDYRHMVLKDRLAAQVLAARSA
jgi:hypothetical protein